MTAVTARRPVRGGAGAVADAVLYEGYVLYPYRASAPKNQVRWQFGVLVPPALRRRPTASERCVDADRGASSSPGRRRRVARAGPLPAGAAPDGRGADAGRRLRARRRARRRRRPGASAGTRRSSTRSTSTASPLLPGGRARRRSVRASPAARTSRSLRTPTGAWSAGVVRRRSAVDGGVRVAARWADGPGALLKVRGRGREHDRLGRARRRPRRRRCAARSSACTRCWPSTTARSSPLLDPPDVRRGGRRRLRAATAPSRCSSATGDDATSCCRRRSSSTTTRRSRPRARATCATPPRSTRSWPCGS